MAQRGLKKMPQGNRTGKKTSGQPPLLVNQKPSGPRGPPGEELSPWLLDNWLDEEQHEPPPLLVSYQWLEDRGIFSNRMDAHRKRKEEQFPPPIQLSKNKIAWVWAEVRAWLASRPRRIPGQTNPAATLNLPQFRKAAREKAASKPEGAAP
jgi:hypothetical protein